VTRDTPNVTFSRALIGAAFLVLLGCESGQAPRRRTSEAVAPRKTAATVENVVRVGAPIDSQRHERLAAVLKSPAEFEGQTFVVEGNVRRACSRKGCWMELAADATASSPACRVTFKDYAFFVPTDSAGRMAKVQGTIELVKLKARHVEHLAEEGATFQQKAADGSAEEVHFVATGVELRRPST
jgi:hypothetical protein